MKDQLFKDRIRQMLEEEPFDGSWKLTSSEMESLSEHMAQIAFEVYMRGEDEGYSQCLKDMEEEVEIFMEKEGIKRSHAI